MIKIISDTKTLSDLNNFADTLVKRVQVEIQNAGLNASGNLSNSLEYVIADESDGTHIQVLADNYFLYAEKGRKSGRTPRNFISILEEWIVDKRISVPSKFATAKQFAGAIYYNIKIFGSRRYRADDPIDVVGPVLDEMRPKLNQILENRLVTYVNDSLFA